MNARLLARCRHSRAVCFDSVIDRWAGHLKQLHILRVFTELVQDIARNGHCITLAIDDLLVTVSQLFRTGRVEALDPGKPLRRNLTPS
jgi:hypothetical protein